MIARVRNWCKLVFFLCTFHLSSVHCDIICPNPEFSCDDESTCCQLESGDFGCCPYTNAVCCSDKIHCCPESTVCNMEQEQCDSVFGMWTRFVPLRRVPAKNNNTCAPEEDRCSPGTTCCKTSQKEATGCCPMPGAVCCSDGAHCCPAGTQCDVSTSSCKRPSSGLSSVPWALKLKASLNDKVPCGNGTSKCPDQTTCCQLASGKWGCCPMPDAVCCDDGVHCCPQSTVCDLSEGRCVQATSKYDNRRPTLTFMAKLFSEMDIICDITTGFTCPSDTTCCYTGNEQWGCCPTVEGVCCSDGEHCCPKNTFCDLSRGQCIGNDVRSMLARNLVWSKIHVKAALLGDRMKTDQKLCPDQKQQCAVNETCCKFNNDWKCCPFPQAVCCKDTARCCPHGEMCGTGGQACTVPPTLLKRRLDT